MSARDLPPNHPLRCASCGDRATTTVVLEGFLTPVCLRHYSHWRTPHFTERSGPVEAVGKQMARIITPLIPLDVARHESQTIRNAAIHDRAALVSKIVDALLADTAWQDALLAERVEAALRETADAWTQGEWSNVMLPKPTPPAVPVIAYANRVGDWLRKRAAALTERAES